MSGFTGIKDTDLMIMQQLTDYELSQVCQVNKYANSLCQNESFWFNRIYKVAKESVEKNFAAYAKEFPKITKTFDINNITKFYGLTNKDFYKFMTKFDPKLYFYILLYPTMHKNLINRVYQIYKNILPDWIIYDKLIAYLRRTILEEALEGDHQVYITEYEMLENIPGIVTQPGFIFIPDKIFIQTLMKND